MSFHEEAHHRKDKVRLAQKQDRRVAKRLGGTVVPGSGRLPGRKGDVRVDKRRLLIENKATDKASLSIRATWLRKIEKEAMAVGLTPAVSLTIGDIEWVLLPVWALEE